MKTKNLKGKFVLGGLSLGAAVFTAWLFWGPVLHFFLSLIPANVQYAWVGKILITIAVAYFGGIVFPAAFVALAVAAVFIYGE